MQFTTLLLAALSATTTLAAPRATRRQTDNTLRVILSNQRIELGSQTVFSGDIRSQRAPIGSRGPFQTVELVVGKDVINQAHRCQILDEQNEPITITRGANTDITFADGNAGLWTLAREANVSQIICDPTFVSGSAAVSAPIDPTDNEIRVLLQNQEVGIVRVFQDGGRQEMSLRGRDAFQTITVTVGEAVRNQGFRCQALDLQNVPLVARRGENVDTTFADGGKGAWKFVQASAISRVVCDPAFVADNLAA